MADAAARREARRKRILENSESRLQRITGSNSTVREEKVGSSSSNLENDDVASHTIVGPQPALQKNHIFNETIYLGKEAKEEADDDDVSINASTKNDLRKRDNARGTLFDDNIDSTDYHAVQNQRFSISNERKPQQNVNADTNESEQDVDQRDSIQRVFNRRIYSSSLNRTFASKWMIVILAAFVNILYFLKLHHFYGKTILAPFLTLLLARLHFDNTDSIGQGGSLLSAALILCNMKPELVYAMRLAMRIFKKLTEEFAIYIFSYIIFYNAACSYWNDIELTMVSK